MAIEDIADHRQVHLSILQNGMQYKKLKEAPTSKDVQVAYCKCVKKIIQKYDEEENYEERHEAVALGQMLRKSIFWKDGCVHSSLITTCKTHKAPDAPVTHRNIHSSTRYAFMGVSWWLKKQLVRLIELLLPLSTRREHAFDHLYDALVRRMQFQQVDGFIP